MFYQINKNTSSGEKKATESGYTEPAGCKDITALKIEGYNSSITEIFSAASSFIVACPNLFELWKLCSFDGSTKGSFDDMGSKDARFSHFNRGYVKLLTSWTSFSRHNSISDTVANSLGSSSSLPVDVCLSQRFFDGDPASLSSSRWGKNRFFWSVNAFNANLPTLGIM